MRESFESKVSYKFDIEPFGQNANCIMARKLSYKYDIEKQEKSLSQAKCPISLTALYWYLKTGPLYNDTAAEGMVESLSFRYKFYPCKKYSVFYYHENRKAALE